jgi:hypothetical protein
MEALEELYEHLRDNPQDLIIEITPQQRELLMDALEVALEY